jgi:SAM-dependent methyltransferase
MAVLVKINHKASPWLVFWDTSNSIFVNPRHKEVHYRQMAEEILRYLPSSAARVLDYGSGEALHANLVAAVAGQVLLCEGAPSLRAGIASRFANVPNIRALAPEEVERLQPHSLDLIVLHSVTQYLTPVEAQALFALFHRLLERNGMLIVSDVIPPSLPAVVDALALLRFSAANGFLIAALGGLVRTSLSSYWRLRKRFGSTRHLEVEMIDKLTAAGFSVRRASKNFGEIVMRPESICSDLSAIQ